MLGMRVLAGAAFIIAAIVLATRYLSRFVSVKRQAGHADRYWHRHLR